jgi:hypothetical protein
MWTWRWASKTGNKETKGERGVEEKRIYKRI